MFSGDMTISEVKMVSLKISDKTPLRLTQVSLAFSFVNFLLTGLNWHSILVFLIFTISVYASCRVAMLLLSPHLCALPEAESLKFHLSILGVVFIAIATFSYSLLFGIFYVSVTAVYLISPYDRDWLMGESKVVVVGNKVEYRKEESTQ
jgi:hypothetical protein